MDTNITPVQPKKKKKKKLIIALSVTAVLLAIVLCLTAVVAGSQNVIKSEGKTDNLKGDDRS